MFPVSFWDIFTCIFPSLKRNAFVPTNRKKVPVRPYKAPKADGQQQDQCCDPPKDGFAILSHGLHIPGVKFNTKNWKFWIPSERKTEKRNEIARTENNTWLEVGTRHHLVKNHTSHNVFRSLSRNLKYPWIKIKKSSSITFAIFSGRFSFFPPRTSDGFFRKNSCTKASGSAFPKMAICQIGLNPYDEEPPANQATYPLPRPMEPTTNTGSTWQIQLKTRSWNIGCWRCLQSLRILAFWVKSGGKIPKTVQHVSFTHKPWAI